MAGGQAQHCASIIQCLRYLIGMLHGTAVKAQPAAGFLGLQNRSYIFKYFLFLCSFTCALRTQSHVFLVTSQGVCKGLVSPVSGLSKAAW